MAISQKMIQHRYDGLNFPILRIYHYTDSDNPQRHGFVAVMYAYKMYQSSGALFSDYTPSSYTSVKLNKGGSAYAEMPMSYQYTQTYSTSGARIEWKLWSNSNALSVPAYSGSQGSVSYTVPSEPPVWYTLAPGTYSDAATQTITSQGKTTGVLQATSTFTVNLSVGLTSGNFYWNSNINYTITGYNSSYNYNLYFCVYSQSNANYRKSVLTGAQGSGTYKLSISEIIEVWFAAKGVEGSIRSLTSNSVCYMLAIATDTAGVQVGQGYISLGTIYLYGDTTLSIHDATVGAAMTFSVSAAELANRLGGGELSSTVSFYKTTSSEHLYGSVNVNGSITETSIVGSWNPDAETVGAILPDAASGDLYGKAWRFLTYNGKKYSFGYSLFTNKKTITLPESVYKPTPQITSISDSESFLEQYGFCVSRLSVCSLVGANGLKYSATAVSEEYRVTREGSSGATYNGRSVTIAKFDSPGTYTITFTVRDSRGFTASASSQVVVKQWSPPTLTDISVHRGYYENGEWTADDNGDWVKVDYTAAVSPVDNMNQYTIEIILPEETITNTYTSDYDASRTVYGHADTESSWTIYFTIEDLYESTSLTYKLSTAGVVMDFLRGGKGVGIGQVAERENEVIISPEWVLQAYQVKIGDMTLAEYIQSVVAGDS